MTTIIDLARNIRERHNKPLKTPLKEMVIVHPDADFLDDIAGKLREYVLEELNVKTLRAEPNFSILGKRLGKSMGAVSKEVKAMSTEAILTFEKAGEITIAGHVLKLSDIKINRDFKPPGDVKIEDIDAKGDGDVLVILNLCGDESLYEAGVAREIVNRIQKLRKKAGLEPTDLVEVDEKTGMEIVESQGQYIREALGSPLLPHGIIPAHAVVVAEESFHGISNLSFSIILARPALVFNSNPIDSFDRGLRAYLLMRDHHNLKAEFQLGKGKIHVSCIENQPPVSMVLGEHVFLTVGDYFSSNKGGL